MIMPQGRRPIASDKYSQDEQLLEAVHQEDQQGAQRADDHAGLHHRHAADPIRHCRRREAANDDEKGGPSGEGANLAGGEMKRPLGEHQQRTGQGQVVAFDEADKPEHHDHHDVVGAEWNRIELASEQMAGGSCRRSAQRGC
jgi:hypothetical protein